VVERKTRFVILSKMRGCTAEAALEGFSRQMKRLPAVLRKSMTCDRGTEMACHPELARRLKIDIWFCDPHAPWQRGSNPTQHSVRSLPRFERKLLRRCRENSQKSRCPLAKVSSSTRAQVEKTRPL